MTTLYCFSFINRTASEEMKISEKIRLNTKFPLMKFDIVICNYIFLMFLYHWHYIHPFQGNSTNWPFIASFRSANFALRVLFTTKDVLKWGFFWTWYLIEVNFFRNQPILWLKYLTEIGLVCYKYILIFRITIRNCIFQLKYYVILIE